MPLKTKLQLWGCILSADWKQKKNNATQTWSLLKFLTEKLVQSKTGVKNAYNNVEYKLYLTQTNGA